MCKMNKFYFKKINLSIFFILNFLLVYCSFGVEIYKVSRTGRPIQLDGFLLEWNKDKSYFWGSDSTIRFDMCKTKEGLAGYFKIEKDSACLPYVFKFFYKNLTPDIYLELNTSKDSLSTFYKLSCEKKDKKNFLVYAEWLLPWRLIGIDSSNTFKIGLFAINSCNDSLKPIILSGDGYNKGNISEWKDVNSKLIFIGIMLILFFYFQRKTSKKLKKKQKEQYLDI